jgi:hypothetical protein
LPLVPILSQMNLVHTLISYFFWISFHLCLGLSGGFLPSDFQLKFCMIFSYPTHIILFTLIIIIHIGQVYKLWISCSYTFLQFPVTSLLLGPFQITYKPKKNTAFFTCFILSQKCEEQLMLILSAPICTIWILSSTISITCQ